MFGTVRLRNIRIAAISAVCVIIIAAVCLPTLRLGAPDTVEIGGESYSMRAENGEDIKAFISACGYETDELISDREITVPKIWNDTYKDYNDTQLRQGFDLTPYKGKPARELIYSLVSDDGYITLLVSEGRMIAAHKSAMDGGEYEPLISDP